MTPDRWQRIKQVLASALERNADQRECFVASACAGDAELQHAVQSLLRAEADTLIPTDPCLSRLAPGMRLGPYEIRSLVGEGGMGEVYRAHDTRLARDVAIKVLPWAAQEDADRRERLDREAKALAVLSHPNVLAIYDTGEFEGVPYLVCELLDGQTLRERLRAGALPPAKALRFAAEIASGLAAAHERGIVHRDLKPENVFLTRDERIKVLDFGLAKRAAPAASSPGVQNPTAPGTVMGTPAYMAPEQACGLEADHRADLFALGTVLFEMLTGRPAFHRACAAETLAAILREDPPLGEAPALTPTIALVLQRCLEKRPERRFQSARDLAFELELLASQPPSGRPVPSDRLGGAKALRGHPMPRVRLVGRSDEVAAVTGLLLQDGARLVTLTGRGGVGKTLLALQVVSELADRHPGGAYVVSLASIADADMVVPRIAEAMGARLLPGQSPFDSLAEQLSGRDHPPTLLLLDNFEHVMRAAETVAQILDACPALRTLVTSREVLRVRGEQEFAVPPLASPDPVRLPPLPVLAAYPAVALFLERAAGTRPGFVLTADNAAAVAAICARLEGLPLAIELAATRIRTLPPAALLARLGNRLDLLTGGPRDAPPRQQTLRGAFDWSHELLTPPEQRLFRRLSVFAGGCSLDAVEAVCNTGRDLGVDVLDGLSSLVEKSLVQQTGPGDGDARFGMLDTVREYAAERLCVSGEEASTRRAHAAYCLVLAEEEEAEAAPGGVGWAKRLTLEQDNLRAALEWLRETREAEWGLRLAAALFPFWELREQLEEGRQRLSSFLALPGASAPKLRARALFALGVLAHGQGDYVAAREALESSLAFARELGDARSAAAALNDLGVITRDQGDLPGARERFEESARLWRDVADGAALARTLSNLAGVARDQADYARARSLHHESHALLRAQGDRAGMAWSLNRQGDVAWRQGDVNGARALYEAGLLAFRELDDQWGVASSLDDLGSLARAAGDLQGAKALYDEGLRTFQRLGFRRGVARLLEGLACCAIDEGRPAQALKAAGAAAALRRTLGAPLPPAAAAELERALEGARRALPGTDSDRAWKEGWLLSMDEAIDYALGPED